MSGKKNRVQKTTLLSFYVKKQPPPPSKKAKVTAAIDDAKPSATASTSTSKSSNPKKSKSSDKSNKAAAETKLKDTSITIKDTSLEDMIRMLDALKNAQNYSRALQAEIDKKNRTNRYNETFEHMEREGVGELEDSHHKTIKRRVSRTLGAIITDVKNGSMVGVCYAGQYPTGGKAGNNDTISMSNVDGTTTLIKLVSANYHS